MQGPWPEGIVVSLTYTRALWTPPFMLEPYSLLVCGCFTSLVSSYTNSGFRKRIPMSNYPQR